MSQPFLLSFKPGILLIEQPEDEQLVLQSSNRGLTIQRSKPGLTMVVRALANGGATLPQLSQIMQQNAEGYSALKFFAYLQKFTQLGWLCHSVVVEGRPIATAVPMVSDYQFPYMEVVAEQKYILSRFAYCHLVEGQLLLESPLSRIQVRLADWRGAALVTQLAKPGNYSELGAQVPGVSPETAQQFVSLLSGAQMLSEVLEDGTIQEQTNIALAQWEFHDLLFHTRSRAGRHANSTGGTYRFLGKIEPLPAVKSRMSEVVIELYKPNLETLKTTAPAFTQILEARRSVRSYGETPIAAQQLGEFLYRCARVKYTAQSDHGEFSSRPYPSGGRLYELELYPIVNKCDGIPSGLYHYHPQTHQLCWLSGRIETVEALLNDASQSMGQQDKPQVLIIIAARFGRLTWKYEAIAYALILKHVGILYQTMYLVATAMDLAPCSLGSGNSDLFARAIDSDYYVETSVGEFALGSQRPNSNELGGKGANT